LRAFGQNRATLRRAASARGFSRWQIKFDDGRALADGAFGGSGAAPNATGRHAAALEWALGDSIASVERAEKAFPILFQTRAPRAGSGGAGQQRGGNGQLISFTVLAPALFSWSLRHAEARIAGLDGGKSGLPADATIARAPLAQAGGAQAAGAGAKREALPAAGEIRLAAGDTILVRTAGGGGFGEIAAVKADEED
jgi:5-oxoprolinase (ATP-hydrolysing)